VLDTNTVVSGFLWENEPRLIIDAAIDGRIELFTCVALIDELAGVLPRQKFAKRLSKRQLSIPAIVERYRILRGHRRTGHTFGSYFPGSGR
jgi:putative PIN family toxin of toxin-antitoxin system